MHGFEYSQKTFFSCIGMVKSLVILVEMLRDANHVQLFEVTFTNNAMMIFFYSVYSTMTRFWWSNKPIAKIGAMFQFKSWVYENPLCGIMIANTLLGHVRIYQIMYCL